MKQVFTLRAPAKINLFLKVLNRRTDGYHNLSSLMQMVGYYDLLTFQEAETGIQLKIQNSTLPPDKTNLVFAAATSLQKQMLSEGHPPKGVSITLKKIIPVAAGLGGGSSDAVATLIGLNRLWSLRWPRNKLAKIGAKIGSDLPFFFYGPTAWISGRGEIVESLRPDYKGWVLIVHPDIPVSTASIFEAYSERSELTKNGRALNITLKKRRPTMKMVIQQPENDLEAVTFGCFSRLKEIKAIFQQTTERPVLMSGSGPTLFSLFENEEKATEVGDYLKQIKSAVPFQILVVPLLQKSPF